MTAADLVTVDTSIHPDDDMFRGNLDAYLVVGRSALHVIEVALCAVGNGAPETILDLPCGYGRVLRHMRSRWPDARIVACDLLTGGVDFCAAQYGAEPVYSHKDPTRIEVEGTFDLVWVGSLLTHLDEPLWAPFLDLFTSKLAPGGILIFTVSGRYVATRPRTVPEAAEGFARRGFGYFEPPGGDGYGIAYASPPWVTARLAKYPDRLIAYWERAWNDHQDAVVLCARRYDDSWSAEAASPTSGRAVIPRR